MSYVGQGAERDNYVWDGTRHLWLPSPKYVWWGATQLAGLLSGNFNTGMRSAVATVANGASIFQVEGPLAVTEIGASVRVGTHPVDLTYNLLVGTPPAGIGAATALTLTINAGVVSGSLSAVVSIPAGTHFVQMQFDASAASVAVVRYIMYAKLEALPS